MDVVSKKKCKNRAYKKFLERGFREVLELVEVKSISFNLIDDFYNIFINLFNEYYVGEKYPYVYLTIDGSIQVEWEDNSSIIEFKPNRKIVAYWYDNFYYDYEYKECDFTEDNIIHILINMNIIDLEDQDG